MFYERHRLTHNTSDRITEVDGAISLHFNADKLVPPYFKEHTDNSHHRYIIMDQLPLKYKTTKLSCKAEASNKIKSPASLNMSETCWGSGTISPLSMCSYSRSDQSRHAVISPHLPLHMLTSQYPLLWHLSQKNTANRLNSIEPYFTLYLTITSFLCAF